MTAYDRTKAAMYGIGLGRALEDVDRAVAYLGYSPGDTEVEESIGDRTAVVIRALRKALREAEMLHSICRHDDMRAVKRLSDKR